MKLYYNIHDDVIIKRDKYNFVRNNQNFWGPL